MTDRSRALLDAILAQPDDDDLRLVYADALEEDGDLARAEFLRAQIAIARAPKGSEADPKIAALRERARLLEAEQGERFAGSLASYVTGYRFERGLVAEVEADPIDLGEHAAEILDSATIHTILVGDVREREDYAVDGYITDEFNERNVAALASLARCPHLARVVRIDAHGGYFGDDDDDNDVLTALLASPHLTRLESLSIGIGSTAAAARAIADAHARLPALRSLTFDNPLGAGHVGDEGTIALAASPLCARLVSLEIIASDIGPEGAEALARSLRSIRSLSLGGSHYVSNAIGPTGARALASAKGLSRLSFLELAGAHIGDEGLESLATAPWLPALTYLGLDENDVTDRSIAAIARSPFVGDLQVSIIGNEITPELRDTLEPTASAGRIRLHGHKG